jgi:hypothetical protein
MKMILRVDFKLFPPSEGCINEDWVTKHWSSLTRLDRLKNYQHISQDNLNSELVKRVVKDTKDMHRDISDIVEAEFGTYLAKNNDEYRHSGTEQLLKQRTNIISEVLKTRGGEDVTDYIRRIVSFLLLPTKSDGRSSWVGPARDKIQSQFGFVILDKDPEGKRKDFIDGIAQEKFSDCIAQRINRALAKNYKAKFYSERPPPPKKLKGRRLHEILIKGTKYHYIYIEDHGKSSVADAKNAVIERFAEAAREMINTDGCSASETIDVLKSEVRRSEGRIVQFITCLSIIHL